MPAWVTPQNQAEGERRFRLGRPDIRLVTSKFDLPEFRLSKSPLFPDLPVALDSVELKPQIEQMAPVDRVEIVEWMHESAADNAITSARLAEYNRYSYIAGTCGDGYIPGVRVANISFQRVDGYTVSRNGYCNLLTPYGTFSVPLRGGRTVIQPDFLAWGGIKGTSWIQYYSQALQWVRLARTPITSDVGFISYGGIAAPHFFAQTPDEESERVRVTMRIASNKDQRIALAYRSPSNYTRVIDQQTLDLRQGENEISFIVASYPSVPVVALHSQPSNYTQTVLREYRAEAI